MKYVCIDDGAVAEMISGRVFQSINFAEGAQLLQALSGNIQIIMQIGKIVCTQDKNALFLSTSGPWKNKKYLVVDCETSLLFSTLRKDETLVSFQKLLRFCAKFWSGGHFNRSEHIVQDSSKAVIFPLPQSEGSFGNSFRIIVEREPDKKRLSSRDMDGHFLLAYRTCSRQENSADDKVNYTNFKKAFNSLPVVYSKLGEKIAAFQSQSNRAAVAKTSLPVGNESRYLRSHLPYEDWGNLLTSQQLAFVRSSHQTPHRLIGPAGTGKTLSLLLKTLRVIKAAEKQKEDCRALIITHSEATKDAIVENLTVLDADAFHTRIPSVEAVSLSVETLASLCAKTLKQGISETEFVDKDAQDSKVMQLLYIEQALDAVRDQHYLSHKPYLSEGFRAFFEKQSSEELAPLFQHEISVLIKGRADDQFDEYKKLASLLYGLPLENDADKGLVFNVFLNYQEQLETVNQFDTDDVVLSAVGQLHTPIWRRRRAKEGFDFIAIDETHLFNINELHIFHHFTRGVGLFPISFSVDQAQGVGDRGWGENDAFSELFNASDVVDKTEKVNTVFRSSPDILDFCGSVLASGATLFTNFENSLAQAHSAFTASEERRSKPIKYTECVDDDSMIELAFVKAEELSKSTESKHWEVLITTLSDDILKKMASYVRLKNKPVTILDKRGDYSQVERAKKSGHFVMGHADFVGGLEFNSVIVVGVDKGRVPSESKSKNNASTNFASYSAHNRLYVASSRARFALEFLGVRGRGASELLNAGFRTNLVEKC